LLKEIPDAPHKIYIKGKLPHARAKLICVIGSRRYTSYGKEVCQKLVSALAPYNVSIVSGLALGIDSVAHKTALKHKIHTIAVPGSGLNREVIYPRSHLGLAEQIVEAGGALISEFEPNFRATPWSFPQRNRIMAGLSHLVLVIEAEKKSGTLITARLALEYGREVAAVPGSVFSTNSEGSHYLIRNGATPITCPEDLIETLDLEEHNQELLPFPDLSKNERRVLKLLQQKPLAKSEIMNQAGLSITECASVLSKLELRELIQEKLGKVYLNLQK